MNVISKTIREERKRRGWSQQGLADQLDLSRVTISGIETGSITEIGLRKIERILTHLGYELTVQKRQSIPTLDELKGNNFFFDGRS